MVRFASRKQNSDKLVSSDAIVLNLDKDALEDATTKSSIRVQSKLADQEKLPLNNGQR